MHNFVQKVKGHFENDQYVFFWAGPFSNWHPCKIIYDCGEIWGKTEFNCSEQLMMFMKAMYFKDEDVAEAILASTDPDRQKKLGRIVSNFNQHAWEQVREEFQNKLVYEKFKQNYSLRQILLDTDDKIIVEASPYDKIYGIGMGVDHPDILDETKWNGLNLLGKSLMNARKVIKDEIIHELES